MVSGPAVPHQHQHQRLGGRSEAAGAARTTVAARRPCRALREVQRPPGTAHLRRRRGERAAVGPARVRAAAAVRVCAGGPTRLVERERLDVLQVDDVVGLALAVEHRVAAEDALRMTKENRSTRTLRCVGGEWSTGLPRNMPCAWAW